jgi:hypothetical protein
MFSNRVLSLERVFVILLQKTQDPAFILSNILKRTKAGYRKTLNQSQDTAVSSQKQMLPRTIPFPPGLKDSVEETVKALLRGPVGLGVTSSYFKRSIFFIAEKLPAPIL